MCDKKWHISFHIAEHTVTTIAQVFTFAYPSSTELNVVVHAKPNVQ